MLSPPRPSKLDSTSGPLKDGRVHGVGSQGLHVLFRLSGWKKFQIQSFAAEVPMMPVPTDPTFATCAFLLSSAHMYHFKNLKLILKESYKKLCAKNNASKPATYILNHQDCPFDGALHANTGIHFHQRR